MQGPTDSCTVVSQHSLPVKSRDLQTIVQLYNCLGNIISSERQGPTDRGYAISTLTVHWLTSIISDDT